MTTVPILHHPYNRERDFWRVRSLLIEAFPMTGPDFNWEVRRWDGWHTHRNPVDYPPGWENTFQIWETPDGKVVGAVHPESRGDANLQVHPEYRWQIEPEMVAWAEENLPVQAENGPLQLSIYVHEYDSPRWRLLQRRGYEKTAEYGVDRKLYLGNGDIPNRPPAEGYRLRCTHAGDPAEAVKMAAVLNAGFGRTIHQPIDSEIFFTSSPSFRHDLNLVAEAPDGSFAAHVGVTFEPVNRYGVFEPVCTHPDHRRKGLASSLMFEGLRRLKALGALTVFVETGDMQPANELYESVGFTEAHKGFYWKKAIAPHSP